ncbi:MAG TPA: hypothetical protein VNF50_13420 [Acidimicrobiales bacterium]|nr:hypothetical protein [Acidimicrobiales bacterium]
MSAAAAGLHRQSGSAPLSLTLGLGLMVIPVLLLVLTLPTWEARTVDARDAASAAARTLVTSDSWSDGVVSADQLVQEIGATDGVGGDQISVSLEGSLSRGAEVSAKVTVLIPAAQIPLIGAVGSLHYSATSTQLVDEYRSIG